MLNERTDFNLDHSFSICAPAQWHLAYRGQNRREVEREIRKGQRSNGVGFSEDEMVAVTPRRWIAKNVDLAMLQVQDPIVSNASLGIQFIFDFAVLFQRRVGYLHDQIDLIGTGMLFGVIQNVAFNPCKIRLWL